MAGDVDAAFLEGLEQFGEASLVFPLLSDVVGQDAGDAVITAVAREHMHRTLEIADRPSRLFSRMRKTPNHPRRSKSLGSAAHRRTLSASRPAIP